MKNILITGGAGYIGSNLVDKLLSGSTQVTVIDDLSTGKIDNISHHLKNPKFKFIKGTILNEGVLAKLISRADLVYHLAAAVGVKNIITAPLQGIITNVAGSENVLKLAHKYKKRVLMASTSEIYGKSSKMPFSEDDDRVLGSTKVHRWSYSTSKALDEHLAFAYYDQGLEVSIVRYFNSYGPRVDEKGYGSVVAQFIRQALMNEPITVVGTGLQTRCFTFIEDTLQGTIKAATKKSGLGNVYNIGNDNEISIVSLAKLIKVMSGSKSDIIFLQPEKYYGKGFEDTKRRRPNISKARKDLGFDPSFDLERGLDLTLKWCRRNYKLC